VVGDFNLITSLEEKRGGMRHLDGKHLAFKDFILDQNLTDLETNNDTLTWNNYRGGSHKVVNRLDMFLVSHPLMISGWHMETTILPAKVSNH
jgi:hypothetical protein